MNLPDRVTMSLGVRFFFVNRDIRVLRSSVNNGRSVFAKLLLAVVESLRPSFTVHEGPPTCIICRCYFYIIVKKKVHALTIYTYEISINNILSMHILTVTLTYSE
jgi:hypothetical protein